jgi:sulfatase modifying factor 1
LDGPSTERTGKLFRHTRQDVERLVLRGRALAGELRAESSADQPEMLEPWLHQALEFLGNAGLDRASEPEVAVLEQLVTQLLTVAPAEQQAEHRASVATGAERIVGFFETVLRRYLLAGEKADRVWAGDLELLHRTYAVFGATGRWPVLVDPIFADLHFDLRRAINSMPESVANIADGRVRLTLRGVKLLPEGATDIALADEALSLFRNSFPSGETLQAFRVRDICKQLGWPEALGRRVVALYGGSDNQDPDVSRVVFPESIRNIATLDEFIDRTMPLPVPAASARPADSSASSASVAIARSPQRHEAPKRPARGAEAQPPERSTADPDVAAAAESIVRDVEEQSPEASAETPAPAPESAPTPARGATGDLTARPDNPEYAISEARIPGQSGSRESTPDASKTVGETPRTARTGTADVPPGHSLSKDTWVWFTPALLIVALPAGVALVRSVLPKHALLGIPAGLAVAWLAVGLHRLFTGVRISRPMLWTAGSLSVLLFGGAVLGDILVRPSDGVSTEDGPSATAARRDAGPLDEGNGPDATSVSSSTDAMAAGAFGDGDAASRRPAAHSVPAVEDVGEPGQGDASGAIRSAVRADLRCFAVVATHVGSDCEHPELNPGYLVTLRNFCVDHSEATVWAYSVCVACGGCTPPRFASGFGANWANRTGRLDHPINGTTWDQAAAFCGWLGKRLCAESEWEAAARGEGGRCYPWEEVARATCGRAQMWEDKGADVRCGEGTNGGCNLGTTAPVCTIPDGDTPERVCDLAGNVSEWVGPFFERGSCVSDKDECRDPFARERHGRKTARGGSFCGGDSAVRSDLSGYVDEPLSNLRQRGIRCCWDSTMPLPHEWGIALYTDVPEAAAASRVDCSFFGGQGVVQIDSP